MSSQPPLLALPSELRNRIFELALIGETYARIWPWPFRRLCRKSTPALCRTNQQIRSETLPLYCRRASLHISANNHWEMGRCAAWLRNGSRLEGWDIMEVELYLRMFPGHSVSVHGFSGAEPIARVFRDLNFYPAPPLISHPMFYQGQRNDEVLSSKVEALMHLLMAGTEKGAFGVREYVRFGQELMNDYWKC